MKRLLPLFFVFGMMFSGCGNSFEAINGTIKIASQSPLSGGQASAGIDIRNGAEMGLSDLSGTLTKMDFKVEFVAYDDEATPEKGVLNAKKIVADPSILCVVGHYNSGVQIPSSEIYHASELANVSPANTTPIVTDRGYAEINRIVGRDDVQGVVGAQFAKRQNIASVYVLHDKTAYGEGIAEFFKQEAEAQGIKIVGFEGTEEKANFDTLVSSIIAANPDAVYFGGIYDQIAVFLTQVRQKGYMGMLITVDGFDTSEAARIAGEALMQGRGVFFSTVAGSVSLYPGAGRFQSDFREKYNADPKPYAAQGYDSMGICLKAIENAAIANGGKMPSRAQVAQAIRALKDYEGVTGRINFDAKGDLLEAKYFVMQVTSANVDLWKDNAIVEILSFAPPR